MIANDGCLEAVKQSEFSMFGAGNFDEWRVDAGEHQDSFLWRIWESNHTI